MSRFDYVMYDGEATAKQKLFKEDMEELAKYVAQELPEGRAKALVFTKLEEAYMWMGKAIRDDQIKRNGDAALMEERKNG